MAPTVTTKAGESCTRPVTRIKLRVKPYIIKRPTATGYSLKMVPRKGCPVVLHVDSGDKATPQVDSEKLEAAAILMQLRTGEPSESFLAEHKGR